MSCGYCELRCNLESARGVCGRYRADGDKILETQPHHYLQPYFNEIEAMPFFHVAPGSHALQTGTKSCNARCDYCINAHVAIEQSDYELIPYAPEDIIAMAKDLQVSAIVFGVNEVTTFLPSAIEVAKAARQAGLLTGCLTNGFQTEETAHELAAHMDMINVSLKSMSDEFYRQSLRLPSVAPVLRNIGIFRKNAHVEIITPIAREISLSELDDMAAFIEGVDPCIPWHLFRLFRTHQRQQERGRDFEETITYTETVRKRLPYTYFGNFPGSKWEDTLCGACAHPVIRRVSIGACGAKYLEDALTPADACPMCAQPIPILRAPGNH
jgi:pyruvate-formate lyase-activating enzyme